jgi:hypothetical protein
MEMVVLKMGRNTIIIDKSVKHLIKLIDVISESEAVINDRDVMELRAISELAACLEVRLRRAKIERQSKLYTAESMDSVSLEKL